MTSVIIRRARSSDLPTLGRLGALLISTHHEFDNLRFIAPSPESPRRYAEFLGGQLEENDVAIFVAEDAAGVLGYSYATLEGYDYMSLRGPAGVLHDIIVDPAHRGSGVGRLLLDATLGWLQSRGAPRMVLSTAAKNEAAQRLFAHAGFRKTMIEMTRELGELGK